MIELAEFCGGLIPGVQTVEYAPIAWIDGDVYRKLVNSANNWQQEIIFSQGDWMKVPLLPFDELVDERENPGPNGPSWTLQVAGRILKVRSGVTGTLAEMSRYRAFILRVVLRTDDTPWIIGSLDTPLSFSYSAVADSNRNNYDLRWSAELPHSMHSYIPVI